MAKHEELRDELRKSAVSNLYFRRPEIKTASAWQLDAVFEAMLSKEDDILAWLLKRIKEEPILFEFDFKCAAQMLASEGVDAFAKNKQ